MIKKKAHQLVGLCAKRDVMHPTATVIYNACYRLFRKRSCMTMHQFAWAS